MGVAGSRRAHTVLSVICVTVLSSGSAVAVSRRGPDPAATMRAIAPVASAVRVGPPATTRRAPAPAAPPTRPKRTQMTRFGASGRLAVVPGTSAVVGSGPLRRYLVEVEAGLDEDPAAVARSVDQILGDARGWSRRLGIALQRVDSGSVAFRVTLASPDTADRLCRPLRTGGIFSCFMRGRAVLNVARWRWGAKAYGDDLAGYRRYVVNHEVGHALGFGHRSCPGRGRPAPVMMQQTKGVGRCAANPWPTVA